jgi:Xaa-Pro aminopeptidase
LPAVIRTGRMLDAIAEALKGRGVRRLAFESSHMTVAMKDDLDCALRGQRLVALAPHTCQGLREVKDSGELAAIGKAAAAAQGAFGTLIARGRAAFVGKTERQIAAELDHLMRLAGAERCSFETIVACGANAALPHYRPQDVRIKANDCVLIDWGAVVAGYCSDLTRVVFTGRIPPQIARIYEVALRAQAAGIAAVRVGVTGEAADAAARELIVAAGFGEAFNHSLGHGLGLEVHEWPRLGRKVTEPLRAGMVVTVEPGIYLPGVGGVRIEDDVLVTASGPRRLTTLPASMEAMILK